MKNGCDIVYVLGTGSIWQDNEIRYSLRSVQKYLSNVRNVWIIGRKPEFIAGVHHIDYDDISLNKEANICRKVLRACKEEDISQDFLFFNDDHFLLQPFDASTFPFFYKGNLSTLANSPRRGIYYRAVRRTVRELTARGYQTIHFDTHTPIIYNKTKFEQVMAMYDWDIPVGMTVKSIYCNTLRIEGVRDFDCKINGLFTAQDLFNLISDRKVFSIGNKALGPQLEIVLNTLYPTPSQWER